MALKGLLPVVKKVKVDRFYDLDELHEILSTESNIEGLYIQGKGLNRCLYARGVGKYDVSIAPGKKYILLNEYVRKGKGKKDFLASAVTLGITDIVGRNQGIETVIKEYAAEVDRVLNKKD